MAGSKEGPISVLAWGTFFGEPFLHFWNTNFQPVLLSSNLSWCWSCCLPLTRTYVSQISIALINYLRVSSFRKDIVEFHLVVISMVIWLLLWDLCRGRLSWRLVQGEGRCSPHGNQEDKGKDEWFRMLTRTCPSHPPPQSPCHRQKFLSQQLPNKYTEVYINYKHSTNKLFQLNPFPLICMMPQGSWLLPPSHFVCLTHSVSDWQLPRLFPSLPNILCLVVTPILLVWPTASQFFYYPMKAIHIYNIQKHYSIVFPPFI